MEKLRRVEKKGDSRTAHNHKVWGSQGDKEAKKDPRNGQRSRKKSQEKEVA